VKNEGDVEVGVSRGAYGISYRALVPPSNSVQNLLVPVCLSASHAAFGSIRMEPVFMMLGHAAGSAAVLALNDGVAVQSNDYPKLRAQLIADAQIIPGASATNIASVIVDNSDTNGVAITGAWVSSTATPGYYGTSYIHDNNTNKGACSVRFTPTLPADGAYTVYARWTTNPNRATNTPIDVIYPGGSNTFFVNQQASNGVWVPLLTTNFLAGTGAYVVVRNAGTFISAANGYVIADAVRFSTGLDQIRILAADADAYESGPITARFIVQHDSASAPAVTVSYAVSGTATPTNDYAPLSGTVTIPSGSLSAPIVVQPVADTIPEGDETVIVTLLADTNYAVVSPSSATVTIHDPPKDAWKFAHFSPSQLADPNISGDLADPDHDGRANLLEYALGGNPLAADSSSLDPAFNFDAATPRFSLQYAKTAANLAYEVQWTASLSLSNWSTGGVSGEIYNPSNGLFSRYITPSTQNTNVFLRLSVHP
jgi:hypothetical protein